LGLYFGREFSISNGNMDSNNHTRSYRDYLESRILGAHPVEIVALFYQVAIDNLNEAIAHLKSGDHLARSAAVTRAEQAVHELLIALDHSVNAPFTRTSEDLYRYALERIVTGHARRSEEAFREALAVLTPLAAAWADLKSRLCQEPAEQTGEPEGRQDREETISDPYAAYRQNPAAAASRDWSC